MSRIKRAQKLLEEWNASSLIITDPIDIFYLTEVTLSAGTLYLSKEKAILFVDGRYQEAAAVAQIAVEDAQKLNPFLAALNEPCSFDCDAVTYGSYLSFIEKGIHLKPLHSPIKKLRQIKEEGEIQKLKAAAQLALAGMQKIKESLREGMTEEEVVDLVQLFWKERGGRKFSFDPIIAFGANSSKPHYRSSSVPLKQGDIVLVDMGVVVDHYCSDLTRVFAYGSVDPELAKIYSIVYEAKRCALEGCRSGRSLKEIDALSRDSISAAGYGAQFVHSLGHGVGLEIHEEPYLRKDAKGLLEKNMVVTIEPGVYLPGRGGVRLEDMVVVHEGGCENLTPDLDYPEIVVIKR